ncbi:MAG: hypothetical protein WD225_03960 [Ilumatobacteraceae bacterium]
MLRVEFTVEPFVEGRPGPYVTAAIDAVRSIGSDVEVGPFGSSCRVGREQLADLLAALGSAAFANGATHLSVHVDDDGAGAESDAGEGAG